jgi:hypothetical protein
MLFLNELQPNSIKYRVHYNPSMYDHKTGRYVNGEKIFETFNQARAHQWKCEKCDRTFSKFPDLKRHKNEDHAY